MARNVPATKRGFGYDPALGKLSIYADGSRKLDFGNTDMSTEAAVSAGLLFGIGTAATPATTSSAGKFMSFYLSSSVATGDVEGLYLRTYASGGASLNAARIYGTCSAQAADARGLHCSLSLGTTGVTGSAQAATFTLHLPNAATFTGTLSAITCELTADGSSSDPASSTLSFMRFAINGDTTGDDDTITDAFLFDISGCGGSASGSFWYDNTAGVVDEFVKVKTASGVRYLLLADDVS